MRWCYKTIHYELKKEGFLGGSSLDEAEVEQSLNEYGQAGWELVSVMETQDGLIAIFKQPLDPEPNVVGTALPSNYMLENEEIGELITEEDIIDDNTEDDYPDEDGLDTIRIE